MSSVDMGVEVNGGQERVLLSLNASSSLIVNPFGRVARILVSSAVGATITLYDAAAPTVKAWEESGVNTGDIFDIQSLELTATRIGASVAPADLTVIYSRGA